MRCTNTLCGENVEVLKAEAGNTHSHYNNLKGYLFLIPVVGLNFSIAEAHPRFLYVIDLATETKTSVALVRKRNIPTERPPLVGEVNTNFFGWRVPRI
jgi:hypothetical protein